MYLTATLLALWAILELGLLAVRALNSDRF